MLKKGDLVRLNLSEPQIDILKGLNKYSGDILATVVQCRYKTGIYLIFPANSPFVNTPYWVAGKDIEKI